ncbi:hypothetical protein K435DRAFT_773049 [Dendrothele bispora CBS 962.96]|uniref:Late embryogenesis abundant protein n=1 Tax=Dendrothele bispora (strain CBS 962.96) TaxID=1314807 RepID=A0A4S8MVG0_DENBC|nr:hypothetical protein K435DRAFT_773049 [Dendrothele bispora CBS 962.96]
MFRSQLIRVAKTSSPSVAAFARVPAKRSYASLENPGPDVKKPKSNNTLLFTALAAAAAGGAYWYYNNPDEASRLQEKAKADEEEAKKKAREATEAGKARLDTAYKQGQLKYDELKSSVDKTIHDAEARAKSAADSAQAKFDGYRKDARDSTENLYTEARASAEKKEEQAKAGWFSWLGWGKSKAEETKQAGAEKVSEAAGDVKSKADKRI